MELVPLHRFTLVPFASFLGALRQRRIINRMLAPDFKGYMNTSKYAKLAKCSNDTALRDIQTLKERGIFIQNPGGGRSTSYRLPDKVEKPIDGSRYRPEEN